MYSRQLSDVLAFLVENEEMYNFCNISVLSEKRLKDIASRFPFINGDLEEIKKALQSETQMFLASNEKKILLETTMKLKKLRLDQGEGILSKEMTKKMKPKKIREVENFARFLIEKIQEKEITHLIDVGSGLGYLDEAIVENCKNVKVIAIEGHQGHCERAELRLASRSRVKQVTLMLSNDREGQKRFQDLLHSIVNSEEGKVTFGLIGLHCCGDLTPIMIKLFINLKELKMLSVVSCCYHKMSANAYPLSEQLKDVAKDDLNVIESHFALRLACQETLEKWLQQSPKGHEDHSRHFGYRAILEEFCHENRVNLKKKKRRGVRKSQFNSIDDFVENVCHGYDFNDCDMSLERIKETLTSKCLEYEKSNVFDKLEILTGLQLNLQSILENLILLDRLLFLVENGLDSTSYFELFDCVVSPRNKLLYSFR